MTEVAHLGRISHLMITRLSFFMPLLLADQMLILQPVWAALPTGRLGRMGWVFDVDAISAVEGGGGSSNKCSSDDSLQLVEVDRRRWSKFMECGRGAAVSPNGSLL